MAALKALVIVMGMLIAAAMALIAWGLYEKAADPDFKPFAGLGGDAKLEERPIEGFPHVDLDLPEGCAIVDIQPDDDRLFVVVGPGGACARIVVIDIDNGRVLGTIGARP